ncbi:MAG: diguanylate cyclase domain-containing protein [Acidothermaceae bacterium]
MVSILRRQLDEAKSRQRLSLLPAWQLYLILWAVPAVLAPFFLTSQWSHAGLDVAIAYGSAAACYWRFRSGRGVPVAWLWIAAGVALNASGGIAESISVQVLKSDAYPTLADAFYLAIYPCVAVGLLIIVRSRNPLSGPVKLIDASTLTVGMGLLCWIYLIKPNAGVADSVLARTVNISYPVGDLVLLAILARVLVAQGWRTPTVRLLLAMLTSFLVGDVMWAIINQMGWATDNQTQALVNEVFVAAYALLGAAALHPSARELDTQQGDASEGASRTLFVFLSLASLVAPGVLAAEAIRGKVTDGIAIAICSAQLTALVVARMGFLIAQLQSQSSRLRDLTLEDPLTGLPNRRRLQVHLTSCLNRARRDGQPLTLVMLDLDHFKAFNDEFGHVAGDHLLKSAAAAWSSQLRDTDIIARVGGEEFVLVLPDTSAPNAEIVVSKLQQSTPLGQTFSAGIVQWDGRLLYEELVEAADAAMYQAKRRGRNRAVTPETATAAANAAASAPATRTS